jgi:hypothetical protein
VEALKTTAMRRRLYYNKDMMRRIYPLIFIFLLPLSFLSGQEVVVTTENGEEEPEMQAPPPDPFPLGPILLTALQRDVSWRPDWDISMPPDAFRLANGDASSIVISINEEEYRVGWDRKGNLTDFPVILNGSLVQVKAVYDARGLISRLSIDGIEGLDDAGSVEFMGDKENPLAVARIYQDGTFYFAAIHFNPVSNITETWYDEEGNFLAHFTSNSLYADETLNILTFTGQSEEEDTAEWFYYNSFGHISEIQTPRGVFSALYSREHLPRYWRQELFEGETSNNHALQWDMQGFLLGIFGEDIDRRYEYTLDDRGNWIERREILMIPQAGGISASSPGLTVRRTITYR